MPALKSGAPSRLGGGGGTREALLSRGLVCVGGWVLHGALFAREKSLEGFPSSQGRKTSCVAESRAWRNPAGLPPGAPLATQQRPEPTGRGLGWAGGHWGLASETGWLGSRAEGAGPLLGGGVGS